MTNNPIRLLYVGPLPPPVGGATVLTAQLLSSLEVDDRFVIRVVNTSSSDLSRASRYLRRLPVLMRIATRAVRSDVLLVQGSSAGLSVVAPFIAALGLVTRTTFVFRRFGGADLIHGSTGYRGLVEWAFRRARVLFVETRHLEAEARSLGIEDVRWIPNNRHMTDELVDCANLPRGRFIFVGPLTEPKGVVTLVAAEPLLDRDVAIDLYGPRPDDAILVSIDRSQKLTYIGELRPSQVQETMAIYDALVVPTMYAGEGYPGVVIEAFGAGIPVIASDFMSIPELVSPDTGVMFLPGDSSALADILNQLARDGAEVQRLRRGVARIRLRYDSAEWDAFVADLLVDALHRG